MNRERYFADPERMPAGERKYWFKVRRILEGLLNDLKERNCLRRATQEETLHFIALMKDKDEIAMSLNMLNRVFENEEELRVFLERNKDYFADPSLSYLYMSQLYFQFLISIEMFRIFLLFYLKRGKNREFNHRMTLNPFLKAVKRNSPVNGQLIENELDIGLRNSFAHGLFRIEITEETEAKLLYYKSLADLKNPTQIPLNELMIKMKNHNIIYHCLVHLVSEKLREGFFRNA